MAVVVAVATLFSERTLKFWILVVGPVRVVEFLYLNSLLFRGSSIAGLDRGRSWVILMGNGFVELSKRL